MMERLKNKEKEGIENDGENIIQVPKFLANKKKKKEKRKYKTSEGQQLSAACSTHLLVVT